MPLRHPTPDLQSLQGAYVKNVERLERSAERLSLTSDIGEELRKMKLEQRRSESRRSSILGQPEEHDARPSSSRQFSHGYGSHASNSIVSTNNVARSGGFSPSAYFASPRSSSRSGSWSHNSVKERSISQGSRLAQMSSSEQENRPLDSTNRGYEPVIPPPDPSNTALRVMNTEFSLADVEIPRPLNISPHKHQDAMSDMPERPPTAASTDTYHQANSLFNDFDGVHIEPPPATPVELQENTNGDTPSTGKEVPKSPNSFMESAPAENMVYYPAPVPMMLNLPQRLSKVPPAPKREQRKSEFLSGLSPNARKSAPWLPNVVEKDDEESRLMPDDPPAQLQSHNRRNMADLPPQLRASVFFDYPTTRQHVEVKGESAVATLDSILDASAFAPVSAFTDHPIVGHAGAGVYSNPASKFKAGSIPVDQMDNRKRGSSRNRLKKRNSASDLLEAPKTRNSSLLSLGAQFGRRKSSGRVVSDPSNLDAAEAVNLPSEETALRHLEVEHSGQAGENIVDENAEFHDAREEFEAREEDGNQEEHDQYSGQPTTLLAELALRKHQQKQRNRTAVTAFPDGMHSTLLELDAVAHVQRQSRKQKHVTLAWEDPAVQHPGVENRDDEDVPLGMLFPKGKLNLQDRTSRFDEDRPLGLIARRAMEDSEPLSHRRARLRGEDPIPVQASPDRRASMYTLDIPGFDTAKEPEEPTEIEGETLGQRRRRLRDQTTAARPRPISGDFASEVMSQFGGLPIDAEPVPTAAPKTPDLEEETLGQRRKRLQAEREAKSSAANVEVQPDVPVQPAKPAVTNRRSMADLLQAHPAAGARSSSYGQQTQWTQEKQRASTNYIAMASRLGMLDPGNRGSMPAAANPGLPLPYTAPQPGAGLYPNPMVFNAPMPYPVNGLQMGQAPLELDSRQRDMIDRWRQSIMY